MEDEEYKKLPVEDRCVHKLWQARKNGYEEVAKLFRQIDDDKSPEFGKYLGLVKKFVVDSHAVCQEKGLEATLAFVENYAHAGRTVGEVMTGIITKCIAAPKVQTRELAVQVILMYIEIEKGEAVQEELLKGMEQKNPKIVSGCISTCTTALREFGSKIITVKPLVKKITTLCSDRDKNVRDEARAMVVEIYRWIGGALRPQLNNLKPVQITELETEFTKVEGQKAVPQRFIRSEQKKQVTAAIQAEEVDGDASDDQEEEETPEVDPYDLADPVDILSHLPKDFFEKIEAKKWQERKEALEVLEKLVNTPKLQNGDYGDLVRALKKIIEKDSNVVVVAMAGRCLTGLATGLKKKFHPYSNACIPSLLEKFKEKKQNVVTAMKDAIDIIYQSTTIEPILDDVIEALGNKNPSVKSETSFFLARAFTRTQPTLINKKTLKALCAPLVKNVNESDPTVRDSAAEALGTLMKLVGEKAIGPFLVELEKDAIKMGKIKESCDKAVITVKIVAPKKERPNTAPAKPPAKSKMTTTAPKSAPSATAKTAAPKKKTASNNAAVVRSKGKAPAKKAAERELGDEEVDEIIGNIVSNSVIAEMADGNYKTRLAAMEQLLAAIKEMNGSEMPAQAVVKSLSRKPGLKDTNFQVLQLKLEIVKHLAENATFSTTTASICLNDIIEKFGDPKNGNLVHETMTAITEATTLSFVSPTALDVALNQKNPKVIVECFSWMATAIKDFGFNDLNAKLLIDSGKKALASSNPAIRQAAINFCGVLFLYIQNPLYTFFESEKATLRDQLSAEFEQYQGVKPPAPTKGLAKCASASSVDNLDEDEGTGDSEPIAIQDLIPRTDISGQFNECLLNELEDKNWKVRTEALGKINQIIQDAKCIKPNLGDLPPALNRRLSDSNKQVAQTALNVCDSIAKAMGPSCKQYVKVFFPNILKNWGDNKTQLRTAAKETIEAYVEQSGSYKEFFENEMIADALKTGTQQLKIELWDWLAEILPKVPVKSIPKEELIVCIPILYSHLEDRISDIRSNSQKAMYGVMIHVGYDAMVKQLEKLKPMSQTEVKKRLDIERAKLPIQPTKKVAEKEEKVVRGTKPVANTKHAVKPKGTAATAKTAATTSKKKEEDIDTSPLLVVNNMKHQRTIDESKLKVLKWNFTTPREEFVDLLREQMTAANVNKNLISNMFHTDFGYHIRALEALSEDLSDNSQALISNLDLILKWLTLRFFDTNPSVVFKGLEYLHSVFTMLTECNYKMLESEAASFLPYLVGKIGDAKFCNAVRALVKQICCVYPVGRVFTYTMEGVKSKNARQRAECLEVMGSILQDHGISVCGSSPAPVLKDVAKQVSDKDKSVRNAALNCLVEAYNIMGDKVYKIIGNILGKDLSLLESRIKHSKRTTILKPEVSVPQFAPKEQEIAQPEDEVADIETEKNDDDEDDNLPPVIMPPKMVQEYREPTGPFALDRELIQRLDKIHIAHVPVKVQEFDLDFLKDDVYIPNLSEANVKAKILPLSPPKPLDHNLSFSKLSQRQQSPKSVDPALLISINHIACTDLNMAMQGLQQVIGYLQSSNNAGITNYENDLFSAIITQLKQLRNQDPVLDNRVAKVYRSILTTMDSFYLRGGQQVSIDNLKNIVDQLIHVLVDKKLERCTNGDAYVRVINLHCVKIIEKSDHTRIICALVNLIHECIQRDSWARHTELVMKCLWRVIKLMPNWGEEIDYDSVLLEVHNFLKEFPSTWWKNKPLDTVLRTIKTILHSCVKIRGGCIMLHFGKIPNPSESEIESYVLKLLKTMNLEAVNAPPAQPPQQRKSPFLRATTQTSLTEIFQKIGNKDETKEGLTLLYDFMQQHPEADIDVFLKKSSKVFQDYIRNGLQEIEDSRASTKSTMEKVEQKAAELITSSSEVVVEENKGPEYWENRLKMLKKKLNPDNE